ncbi:unnamed protein product [Rangifer tarandus platyrhynchus]|uniref:Uncharacterized protein n=2 Tax=Rangifer tarandus platyrhynchus TaxID=3082113 RepID=A0ACB0FHL9_RANTA|nr:unnamed protein product [Rangifer tarandus platyrhynchus]CAI9712555.1 unnamed protein product [Rangifer tarandus platyrhynchus]
MEDQRPELIPYFHSSQGPAEAAEPVKVAFRREDTYERVSSHPLRVSGPARLPGGPVRPSEPLPVPLRPPKPTSEGLWTLGLSLASAQALSHPVWASLWPRD